MKRKPYLIAGLLGIIILGVIGFMWFKHNEAERKEKELIKMETLTAKQIKNTFADITEIEFSKDYVENTLAGFTSVDVTIYTNDDVVATINASMSLNNKAKNLRSYIGGTELKKGLQKIELKLFILMGQR